MDKELQFAKNGKKLVEKVKQIIANRANPEDVRYSFTQWLLWFKGLKGLQLPEIKEEPLYYRAFVIPNENFYAVQIWEKHPTENLVRCLHTLIANRFDIQNAADKIEDNRVTA